jgi:hypothetical protein
VGASGDRPRSPLRPPFASAATIAATRRARRFWIGRGRRGRLCHRRTGWAMGRTAHFADRLGPPLKSVMSVYTAITWGNVTRSQRKRGNVRAVTRSVLARRLGHGGRCGRGHAHQRGRGDRADDQRAAADQQQVVQPADEGDVGGMDERRPSGDRTQAG